MSQPQEASFVQKVLSPLPGIFLLTSVAVFSWFITPKLIALHPFMKSLNLSDFIIAIIIGMVICNTIGVHPVFKDGLRECPAYILLYQFSPKDTGQSKVK